MTNKMAIFVEGQTELRFNSKLIRTLAGHDKQIQIEESQIRGGTTESKSIQQIKIISPSDNSHPSHYFMLFDCGGDAATMNRMNDEYDSLCKSGYSKIICHFDLAPRFSRTDIDKLSGPNGLSFSTKNKQIRVAFVLSIVEVEAWFLAEHTHLSHISHLITPEVIKSKLDFCPISDDMQMRDNPAEDIDKCYQIGNTRYSKKSNRTINAIDYANIAVEVSNKFRHLEMLCYEIDDFLKS